MTDGTGTWAAPDGWRPPMPALVLVVWAVFDVRRIVRGR